MIKTNFKFPHFLRNSKENKTIWFERHYSFYHKEKSHVDPPWIFVIFVQRFIVIMHSSYFQHK